MLFKKKCFNTERSKGIFVRELSQLFLTLQGRPEENNSYFSNVQPCTITCTLDAFIKYWDMQVYQHI